MGGVKLVVSETEFKVQILLSLDKDNGGVTREEVVLYETGIGEVAEGVTEVHQGSTLSLFWFGRGRTDR